MKLSELRTNHVIHCTTQEEWDKVSKLLNLNSYYDWNIYKEKTCIQYKIGFNPITTYENRNYTIIPAKDFIRDNSSLNKSDLIKGNWYVITSLSRNKFLLKYTETISNIIWSNKWKYFNTDNIITNATPIISTDIISIELADLQEVYKWFPEEDLKPKQMNKDELLKLAKEKYPVGTKFKSITMGNNESTQRVITNQQSFCYYDKSVSYEYGITNGYNCWIMIDGKWAEIIEEGIPEYVECLVNIPNQYTKGKIYHNNKYSNLRDYTQDKCDNNKYNGMSAEYFKPSTKEVYDLQQLKQYSVIKEESFKESELNKSLVEVMKPYSDLYNQSMYDLKVLTYKSSNELIIPSKSVKSKISHIHVFLKQGFELNINSITKPKKQIKQVILNNFSLTIK